MSIDDDILIGYALGHLSPEGEAAVTAHLQTHPADAARVAGYLETFAVLALTLEPEALPETGEADLLSRVRQVVPTSAPTPEPDPAAVPPVVVLPRRGGRGTVWWLSGLAAAAVLGGVYVTVLSPDARVARELRAYQTEPGATSYALAQEGQPEALGTLVRLQDGRVFVALDAPPTEPRVYQAWSIIETPESLGTFPDRTFVSAEPVAAGATFGLTLEPPGGSPAPTSTPLALLEL